jgi:ArsR family transcriptional regulator
MATRPKTTVLDDVADCCPSLRTAPLDEARAEQLARRFQALADPARLRVLSLIAAAPGAEICGCDLIEPLAKSQPTISHHLKVLAEAGLVTGTRRGRWVWYRIVRDRVDELRDFLA